MPNRRVKTPPLLQMEAVECGAAALAIVLGYYGRVVPLEELRVSCGISRDGSKASNIVRAARKYGLEATGFKFELESVYQQPLPFIVFWNFNHFLVVEGFRDGRVYLNDPAAGPRVVTAQEFDEGYTGVALLMKPGPDFVKGGRRPSIIQSLRERADKERAALVFALAVGLALVLPGLVVPVFSQIFVDKVLVNRMGDWLRPLLIGMALTAVMRAGLTWLQQHYLARLELKLATTGASRLVWHILRLPAEFFTQRYSGEIATRIDLSDSIAQFLSRQLTATAIDAVMVVFYALLMLAYDPVLTLVGVAAVGIIIGATHLAARGRDTAVRKVAQERGKAQGAIMSGLSTIETLKATGTESDLFSRWGGYHAKYINAKQELDSASQVTQTLPPFLTAVTTATILTLGAYRVMDGALTLGMLVAFQSLMASFIGPVRNLTSLTTTLQDMQGNMQRIDDVLRYRADPSIEAGLDSTSADVGQVTGAIEIRNITFGYSRLDAPLLEGLSAIVPAAGRLALVGASGCGKSTVAKLVTGLFEPWAGEILLDGVRRADIDRGRVTGSVSYVDQDITLFAGTVRDNLTLWDATVPTAVLVQACKDACIHDDITARPGGYDSMVEEGGANFSGGQRQRLEIARSLVTNPRLLVLDEATSSLDSVTEQTIDRNLRRRGCTCIMIAHRLSTVRDADEILVMSRGKVVQRGRHEDLMRQPGVYASLESTV